ncbi:MAG TPA: glycosyltransferase [Ohtaekwangia sp.]
MNSLKFSIIIPVYNRPQEVEELLDSLVKQSYKNFDVLIIEDGSYIRCDGVAARYSNTLSVQYFFKPNSGPGPSRNFGFSHASGDYFVVFDSDCIIPPAYLEVVEKSLREHSWDAWGGPDRAHENFTIVQRAMGYTMSSFLTTGGIRGGKKRLGWFQPRSFNMGISRKTFEVTKGFAFDRFAEDIEFSIRMKKAGLKVGLIPEAFVYHKRRTTFNQFYHQVYNFGRGRALVGKVHPEEVKLTHWIPSLFVMGLGVWLATLLISLVLFKTGAFLLSGYLAAIFLHAFWENKNLVVAALSVPSAILQLSGYGLGFLKERFKSDTSK